MLAASGDADQCILLESSAREADFGRYSILACSPLDVLSVTGSQVSDSRGRLGREVSDDRFWQILSKLLEVTDTCKAPPAYGPGWFGYLGYEMGRTIETLPGRALRDTPLPDLRLAFYPAVIVVDHLEGRADLIHFDDEPGLSAARALTDWIAAASAGSRPPRREPHEPLSQRTGCNFSDDQYRRAVARCIEYIAAGDIFQVNLSRRLEIDSPPSPVELYLALRKHNPSAYAAYMRFAAGSEQAAICSASPELFLRKRGRSVLTRPIKGTCRRSGGPEDERLGRELLASEKDNAELAMIVDLLRNDLGRVCSYHSVKVTRDRILQQHPTVLHLVAEIQGQLGPGATQADLLRATFPGGSITGAPKIRAMEIIDEIEPWARNVYTGCIGCSCAGGLSEWNIAIRTIVHTGKRALVGVGGGIVADSDPQKELEETQHKARGILESFAAADQIGKSCREIQT
jgi:para-aminobenzoate synthetase component 1